MQLAVLDANLEEQLEVFDPFASCNFFVQTIRHQGGIVVQQVDHPAGYHGPILPNRVPKLPHGNPLGPLEKLHNLCVLGSLLCLGETVQPGAGEVFFHKVKRGNQGGHIVSRQGFEEPKVSDGDLRGGTRGGRTTL